MNQLNNGGAGNVPPQIAQALRAYGVLVENVVEAHAQSFYDYQAYPAAGQIVPFQFFQNRIGSGGYTAGNTNMPGNGQFPNPQNFLWTTTEVIFIPGATVLTTGAAKSKTRADDYVAVMTAPAYASVVINTKEYLREAPLAALPQSFGIMANIAIADPAADLGAEAYSVGDVKRTSGMLIPSNTQFSGSIAFDALVPTPSTVAGKIGMRLGGIWYQLAQ